MPTGVCDIERGEHLPPRRLKFGLRGRSFFFSLAASADITDLAQKAEET